MACKYKQYFIGYQDRELEQVTSALLGHLPGLPCAHCYNSKIRHLPTAPMLGFAI